VFIFLVTHRMVYILDKELIVSVREVFLMVIYLQV
jgi:hypothetical protein